MLLRFENSILEFPFVIVSQDPNFFREYDGFVALHKKQFDQNVNLMIGINHDEGNFWNIYNLPKFFDVPEQPLLTLDNFNECVNTAFARLSEVVKDAASYVYLGEKCDYITGKSKFLAEQVGFLKIYRLFKKCVSSKNSLRCFGLV